MTKDTLSYKLSKILKSAFAAAVLPVLIIYIMIGKPDYTIMNGLAHIVLPVFQTVGDIITWPVRAIGNGAKKIHEIADLRRENEKLREKLDLLLVEKYKYSIAIEENKKLHQELEIKTASPYKTVLADIRFEDNVFHHDTFLINRGKKSGIDKGMVVVSFDNRLVGTIIDCGSDFCRVRSLTDTRNNIAIRIAGSDISGFLQGNGNNKSSISFFSDPNFVGRKDLKVITSNISGILPAGIYVGDMVDEKYVDVLQPNQISRVMVLKYNIKDMYK